MSHVHIYSDFHAPGEYKSHPLRVYTPEGYDADPNRRYPVVYMHDGQNVFAHPASARQDTWCANQAMDGLVAAGRIEPWLIVGIDHSDDRFGEYSPWDDHRVGTRGQGRRYAEFVAQHVKPFIDRVYRTRPEGMWTATVGASLGGLTSLYLGYEFPDSFGRIGAVSPSVMWADYELFRHWKAHTGRWSRIQLDAGDQEFVDWMGVGLDYGGSSRAFYDQLVRQGYQPWELRLWLEQGAAHYETDWARRLPETFAWLLS